MSVDSAFKTELIKDATIADITPDLTYAVVSGASSTTYQQFTASSNSNSSLNWSVQLPSESIVMGRDILLNTTMTLTINCGNVAGAGNYGSVPAGQPAFTYGVNSAFSPFPFSQLIGTASAQINNTTVAVNLPDLLPQFLAMNDRAFLTEFNATTPSLPDSDYGTYADAIGANNNPLAFYTNADYQHGLLPRGAYPVSIAVAHQSYGGAIDTSLISTDARDTWVITLSINVTEPIFISPFTWSDPTRSAMGLVGINNFSLTLNMQPPSGAVVGNVPQTRCFGSSSQYITSITAGSPAGGSMFTSPRLYLKFLSTQPSDMIESRNVVPYTDFPRYITPSSNTAQIASRGTSTITTQNIQINQMPSKFIISVRLPQALQTVANPSTFLTITSVSINLNNASGLLSSSTAQNLWKISRRNGSNQTWQQFSGLAQKLNGYGAGAYGVTNVPTGGSILVLDPALDLSLPETLSNGSLGSYNFQAQITVFNQYGYAIQPEVVVICVNDGIMVNNQGTSTTYTGILTRQMVMDAKQMPSIPMTEEYRLVGGKMGNMSLVRHPHHRFHHLHKFVGKHLEKMMPMVPHASHLVRTNKHHLSHILK
jgi:hypothetical protein